MGDTLTYSSKNSKTSNLVTGKKAYNESLVVSRPKSFAQKNYEQLVSLTHGGFGSRTVGHLTFFLLKVAALETVRRFSKNRCPIVWKGLQALQILCYPPFKWIQRWAPFKGLVKSIQILSRPLIVLSIATAFDDQPECLDGTTDCHTDSPDSEACSESSLEQTNSPDSEACSESSLEQTNSHTSHCETAPQILEYEKWLIQLYKELENQGITLSERINENELRRFYTASNNDFSSFLASVKKTIRWRETYRILSGEELEMWSDLVFWHGSDMMCRPCLIVRLGVACRTLVSQDRPRFAQAVILVDCEGLPPLRILMQMMRSCSSLLQDHFPNLLGCLLVIRLPAVVRVVAQTCIQVLKPVTRKKLKIEGEMYQKVLYDLLPTLPSYLGGSCTCMKCSKYGRRDVQLPYATGTSRGINSEVDISDNEYSPSSHPSLALDGNLPGNYDNLLRTAIISVLIVWVFIAFSAGLFDPSSRHLPL